MRFAWAIGIAGFCLTLAVGGWLLRAKAASIGFGEVSGIVHAALGIGFFSGFVSFIGVRLIRLRRKGPSG